MQPFIENHPDIARVSNGALAALRIVTGMNESGEAEFVATLMALPHGVQRPLSAQSFVSIDPETGRIRHAAFPNGEPIAMSSRHRCPECRHPYSRSGTKVSNSCGARMRPPFRALHFWDGMSL